MTIQNAYPQNAHQDLRRVQAIRRWILGGLVLAVGGLALLACGPAVVGEPVGLEACAQKNHCGEGPVYVADQINFAVKASDGTAAGFDLDGIDSADGGSEGCYTKDLVSPDGDVAVDNQLGSVLSALPSQILEIVPGTVAESISNGGLLLTMELVDLQADGDQGAVFRQGAGTPLLGTDGNLLSHQTLALSDDFALGAVAGVRHQRLGLEGGPFELKFRMRFLATPVEMTLRKVRFRWKTLADGTLQGVVGGAIRIDDLMETLGLLGGDDTELRETLKAVFPRLADIPDPETGECTALSATLDVHMIPAFILP